jgi:hypothetical protein
MRNQANSSNIKTLNEFLIYMMENGSFEKHRDNNIKVIIEFSNYLGSDISFNDIGKNKYYHF